MASIDSTRPPQHGPKLRSRNQGAAITLDDTDKRLLNLMQGAFPICRGHTSTLRRRRG